MTFALSHRSLAQFWSNIRLIEGRVNARNVCEYEHARDTRSPTAPHIVPSHKTALLLGAARARPCDISGFSHKKTKLLKFARENQLEIPLDLMVFSRQQRWTGSGSFRCHLFSSAVDIACLLEYEGILVGTPELCAVQAATILDNIELTRFVYELCSSYVIDPTDPRGFVASSPLADKERCVDFIKLAPKQKGSGRLGAALRSMPPGCSASPRETALSMMLSLPPEMGGYGMAPSGLNTRIDLGARAREVYGKRTCVCDLLFGNLDVEYDSTMEHASSASGVNDALRSTALAFEGIEVVHVYAENLRSLDRVDALAALIAEKLGRRIALDRSDEGRAKREHLRRTLLRPHQPLFQPQSSK